MPQSDRSRSRPPGAQAAGSPATSILIRDARPADLVQVQRIYAHHVLTGLASFEVEPPDGAEIERRHRSVAEQGLPYLVAVPLPVAQPLRAEPPHAGADGPVLGYAYAALYRARVAYRYTLENSVYVDGAARGRGVGRTLLAELMARCARLGYRQMLAVIGDSANAASIGLHAALGFREAGRLDAVGFKFGRWVDSVIMQVALGTGDMTLPERDA